MAMAVNPEALIQALAGNDGAVVSYWLEGMTSAELIDWLENFHWAEGVVLDELEERDLV
jgi:hypothetical protein